MGDPAGAPRRLPPARGKRVPEVEINERPILQTTKKRLSANKYYLVCKQLGFYLNKTKLIGAGVRDSCGESASRGDPAGAPRRLPPARGKRVPYVPINDQLY